MTKTIKKTPPKTQSLGDLFPIFVEDRRYLRNVSKKTLDCYTSAWNTFGPYLKDVTDPGEIKETVKQAIIAIQKQARKKEQPKGKRPISDDGINNYLRVVNTLLKWAHEEDHIDRLIKMPKLKTLKKVRGTITPAEIAKFRDFVPSGHQVKSETRLKAMILICLDCGVRVMEVRKLKRENIDLENNLVKIYSGKGRKQRIIPFSDTARKTFYKYIRDNEAMIVDGFLFGTSGRKLYSPRNISRDLKKLCAKLGLRNITFHQLRHTFATGYLQRGGDVMKLRRILGHSNISTTQIYEHLNTEDLQVGFDRLSSLSDRLDED